MLNAKPELQLRNVFKRTILMTRNSANIINVYILEYHINFKFIPFRAKVLKSEAIDFYTSRLKYLWRNYKVYRSGVQKIILGN